MRTFDHFPEGKVCLMCGSGEDKKTTLIPIDGTEDGNNCDAVPVHVECTQKGDLHFNKEANIFYKVGV